LSVVLSGDQDSTGSECQQYVIRPHAECVVRRGGRVFCEAPSLQGDGKGDVLVVRTLTRSKEECIDKVRKGVTQFNAAEERDAAADLQIAICKWCFLGLSWESNAYSCLPSRTPACVAGGPWHRATQLYIPWHRFSIMRLSLFNICFTRA
jgi:hypothetical protein